MTDADIDRMPLSWLPCIYGYLEVRPWLKACFDVGRQETGYFTHRWLARRIKRSTGYLSNVMAGRRGISDEVAAAVADALRLDVGRRLHLTELVALERSDGAERRALLQRITARHRQGSGRTLDASWYAYLSQWYYVAIREMAGLPGFEANPQWIAEQLVAPVALDEIEDCLTILENLELIRVDSDGRVSRGEPEREAVRFGHEMRSLAAGTFHEQMLSLAAGAIDRVDRGLRHLNTKTITMRAADVPLLKARINRLIEEFSDACPEVEADAVYQLQVALFPLALTHEEQS